MKLKRIYSGWTIDNHHHGIHQYSVLTVDMETMHHNDVYVMDRVMYRSIMSDKGYYYGSCYSSDNLPTGHTKRTYDVDGPPSFATYSKGLATGIVYSRS